MLLNADCVFTNLLEQGVLACKTGNWKIISASQTAPYNCQFFINKNNLKCIHSFQVLIKNKTHIVFANSIECLLSSCNVHDRQCIQTVLEKCIIPCLHAGAVRCKRVRSAVGEAALRGFVSDRYKMENLTYNQEAELMKKLLLCTTENDIDTLFKQFNIQNVSNKIAFLRRRMGVEKIYDAPQPGLTEEDDYEFECEAFTEGSWRLLN